MGSLNRVALHAFVFVTLSAGCIGTPGFRDLRVWGPPLPKASEARQSSDRDIAYTWGVFGFEASLAGSGAILLATDSDSKLAGVSLFFSSVAVALGVAYLADRYQWNPTVPRALHGAVWTGLGLFTLGDLTSKDDYVPHVLGGLGGLLGAGFGAWGVRTKRANRTWMWTPVLGAQAYLVVMPTAYLCCNSEDPRVNALWSLAIPTAGAYASGLLHRPHRSKLDEP